MAKQNKGRKFFAASATAALVAAAIVPAASAATTIKDFDKVSDWAKEDVKALVEAGVISGDEKGNFNPTKTINRAEAATIFTNALELEAEGDVDFKDVKKDAWYYDAIAATVEYGIFEGVSATEFAPAKNLTRSEAAKILVEAFELEGEASLKDFADASSVKAWAKSYLEIAVANGVIKGTEVNGKLNLNPNGAITRQEFAVVFSRTLDLVDAIPTVDKIEVVDAKTLKVTLSDETVKEVTLEKALEPNKETEVTFKIDDVEYKEKVTYVVKADAVSAANSTTLTVTGEGLKELKAEEIKVAGYSVKEVKVSEDGKSATLTLNGELVPDSVTKVTVLGKEFDVAYKVTASKISVTESTYDVDTNNQFVAIQVDGKKITAQELINAGYSLDFQAFDSKSASSSNGVNKKLFGAEESTTGKLATKLEDTVDGFGKIPTAGLDLYVKVTLTKGSEVFTSDLTKITIKNLALAADSITKATLLNSNTKLNQTSTTLVTGEKANFTDITVKAGTEEDEVKSGFSVKSSDVSVVSVDSNGELTAQGPGTATVTIAYGKATITKTFTVSNAKRKATNISADKTAVTLTQNSTVSAKVKLLDQYGDAMVIGANGTTVTIEQSDKTYAEAELTDTPADSVSGNATLTFTGKNEGIGSNTVTFRDAANNKIGSAAVRATVTNNDTLAKYSLAVDDSVDDTDANTYVTGTTGADFSDNGTIDAQAAKYVKLDLTGLNSAGVKVSEQATKATEYDVVVNQSKAGVLSNENGFTDFVKAADGYVVLQAGTEAGTATVTVTNKANNKVVASYKVTVVSVGYNVTGATLKNVPAPTFATTLTYKDFLTYSAGGNDPLVTGITLSKASAQPVRLNITNDELYIDKNANGTFDAGEVVVGTVAISTVGKIADSANYTTTEKGIKVTTGDEGTVLFKVIDNNNNVVANKQVKVDF